MKININTLAAVVITTSISVSCQNSSHLTDSQNNQVNRSSATLQVADLGSPVPVLADCVSIEDPKINDNGCMALACAKQTFGAQVPAPTITVHDNTKAAKDNLLAKDDPSTCPKSQPAAVIVGHGLVAQIDTGGEKQGPQNSQLIGLSNEQVWKPSLDQLKDKKLSSLTLLGCFTGYSDSKPTGFGVKLLNDVQDSSGATTVRAPTGTVFCSNNQFYFLDGADWQNAPSPPAPVGNQPHVLSSKVNHFIEVRNSGTNEPRYYKFELDQMNFDQKIPQNQFQVYVTRDPNKQNPALPPDQRARLLNLSDLEAPFEYSGCPIAGTQGYIVLSLPSDRDKTSPAKLTLELLSNGLLRDMSQTSPNIFYRGSPDLVKTLKALLPPD